MRKIRHKLNKKTKIILCILPIITLFALAFLAQKIYAYNGKNEVTANGIKYYDPEECAKDGGGISTHLAGNTVDEKIWNYLISLGFNDAQAAGLMGNFEAESGNNPVRQADGNCWGIAMICTWSGQYEDSRQAFVDAGYGKYLGIENEYSKAGGEDNIPAEDLDGVIKMAIDWIIKYCDEHSYIYDGTYTEWIKTAQTPEEAAEIFTVVYERCVCSKSGKWASRCFAPEHLGSQWDTRYSGYQDLDRRRNHARDFYELYSGNGTTVDSTSSALGSSTGANVTMIGDSITNMSQSAIKGKLADIDIRSQGSKHMFMEGGENNGGPSGKTILNDLVSKNELRDVLVVALGTNDPGALTESQIQSDIIDKALNEGGASKVIFVNNSESTNASNYAKNNEVFNNLASSNPNVEVANWRDVIANNPSLLGSDNIHPTNEGMEEFANLIYQSVGSLVGSQSAKSSGCNCGTKKSTGSYEGGLSEEQAQLLADDYNNGAISRWSTPGNETYDVLNNCVSFSKYIIRVMTDLEWGGGNGRDVVANLAASNSGLETGTEPKPFSIFSTENHTGFIVAVNGDDVLAVESAWPYPGNPQGYNGKLRHYTKASLMSGYTFAYIEDHLNSDFATAIGSTAVSTTTADSAAIVSAQWQDGWLVSGVEGYQKQYYADMGVTPVDNSMDGNYATTSPKSGTMGPNKIVLHSVEGYNESSGIAVYNPSSAALSHFTVDLKNKKTYQHLPINKPSSGVKSHDDTAGVQIEIMGFSTSASAGYTDSWFLESDSAFGDTEWAYLAKLLVAISDETGIPLTSDLDWSTPNRMDLTAFNDYQGVVGHRHVPDNDHTDPGDIWGKVSEQLSKIQSGKTDGTCNTLAGATWSGSFPFLFQCQDEWRDSTFAGGTFCNAGCGITSMAMVISAITGDLTTPPDLAKVQDCDTTSSGDCLLQWATKYGFEGLNINTEAGLGSTASNEQIKQAFNKYLGEGYIIIASGNNGNSSFSNSTRNPFSSSGHYVVFYGLDSDGNWLIADPGGRNRDWAAECTAIGECEAHDNAMDPDQTINNGIRRTDGYVKAYAFKK